MSFAKNLALAVGSLAGFLLIAEAGLAVLGVAPTLYQSDPLVGFAARVPLYVADRDAGWLRRADNKRAFFNDQRFRATKAAGAVRIFCVGGSTTYGRPYADSTSFCGWLRELLPLADPSRQWELINAGGISYASYRVAALMEELVRYQPDLFVIYTGHNEFLEARTYGELRDSPALVLEARAILNRTRIYSALARFVEKVRGGAGREIMARNVLPAEVEALLDDSVGLQAYHRDDTQREGVLSHFRINLNRMVDIAASADADAILVTPASNQRSCSPFKSERASGLTDSQRADWDDWVARARRRQSRGRSDRALEAIDAAIAIDARNAEAHYLRGQILYAASRFDEARRSFQAAIDEDVCPLRASSEAVAIVREVAEARDVPLVDWVRTLSARAAHGIVGDDFFLDHVHTSIDANRLLAIEIAETLGRMGVVAFGPTWSEAGIARVTEEVTSRVDAADHARALTNLAKVFGWAGKYAEAHDLAVRALATSDDAEAYRNAAMNSIRLGKLEEAIGYYREALVRDPDHAAARSDLGHALTRLGRFEEAESALLESIRLEDSERARYNLGNLRVRQQRFDEAVEQFRDALRINPERGEYHLAIGNVYARRGETDLALTEFDAALAKNPELSRAYYQRAQIHRERGEDVRAVEDLRALLALTPDAPRALAQLAWILASDPDPALRDGAQAVALATRAVDLTRGRSPDALGALAAAYAESGLWTQAIDTAGRALRRIDDAADAAQASGRLALYREHQPHRFAQER